MDEHYTLIHDVMENQLKSSTESNIGNMMQQNITIIIGISPNKCGSTYIYQILKDKLQNLKYNLIDPSNMELSYWDNCILPINNYDCTMKDYLVKGYGKDMDFMNTSIIFMEKTPGYIKWYHSTYLLLHNAHLYNMYFYICLRNPIKRLWSYYWMIQWRMIYSNRMNLTYKKYIKTEMGSIVDKIEYDMDMFPNSYPKYQTLLDYLKLDYHRINESKVVSLWKEATYNVGNNIMHYENNLDLAMIPTLISGCYYPQILMWYQTLYLLPTHQNSDIKLSDKLRIFQFEKVTKNSRRFNRLLQRLLFWMKLDNVTKYDKEYINKSIKVSMRYSPRKVDLSDIRIYGKLETLYSDCNQKLYQFLQNHSDLLLFPSQTFDFSQY